MNELKPEDEMRAREALDRIQNFCEEIDYHLPPDEQTGYKMLPDWMIVFEFLNEAEALLREKDKEIEVLGAELSRYTENVAKMVETARAEAVDEFAERVKKAPDILDVNGYSMIGVDIVELIAEEMKGYNE
jgi:hypothetical protein